MLWFKEPIPLNLIGSQVAGCRKVVFAPVKTSHQRHPGLEPGPALFFISVERQPSVYLLARASHSTLYTGVTSDLSGRIWQHRQGLVRGFTQRYGIKRLVWFEMHETME